jgi:quercetin dioxygenase-like cupin family protein
MKMILPWAMLLLTIWARAQAQEAVPLAHGNVPGEPHHHLKIENEYVRVYYVEVPPHEDTQLHQHDHDYIYVSLGPSDVVNAILNKPEIHLQLKDGETHFTRGGFAHVARNLADTPFRNITIELLKPQNNLRNVCEEVAFGAPSESCSRSAGLREKGILTETEFASDETDVSFTRFDAQLGRTTVTTITPIKGTVFIVLNGMGIRKSAKGETEEALNVGDVMWLLAGSKATFSSSSGKAWSYITLGFSGSESFAKPR